MGLWVNTTYVECGDTHRVAQALDDLVRAEGMVPIAPPAPRERTRYEPMQYHRALENDLWGAALFPGAPGWTVIQTAPLEWLGERAAGAGEMRLAALCRALKASAFQFHVYDSTGSVLVEVAAGGPVRLSGFDPAPRQGDPMLWNDERIAEDDYETAFRLLPYGELFTADAFSDRKAEAIATRFGGANAQYCDNLVSVQTLICHTAFDAPGGIVRYYQWPGPSRLPPDELSFK